MIESLVMAVPAAVAVAVLTVAVLRRAPQRGHCHDRAHPPVPAHL